MKKFTLLVVFLLGAIVGAIGLFFFLAFSDGHQQEEGSTKATMAVSTNKQDACLLSAAEQAREIYNQLAVRRANVGVRMQFRDVSQKELIIEDAISQKLYAIVGSFIEPCIVYEEPVKLDRRVLADMN